MDQHETWHGGRPRPWPHCVRWGPSQFFNPQFFAHVCCGQTAGWIKMQLGTEVGLGPGYTVLDGDPAAPERGTAAPLLLVHVCCGQMVANLN